MESKNKNLVDIDDVPVFWLRFRFLHCAMLFAVEGAVQFRASLISQKFSVKEKSRNFYWNI